MHSLCSTILRTKQLLVQSLSVGACFQVGPRWNERSGDGLQVNSSWKTFVDHKGHVWDRKRVETMEERGKDRR